MAKHRTSVIEWQMTNGTKLNCDSKCRKATRVKMRLCPCTGICKKLSTPKSVELLRSNDFYLKLVEYAKARTDVRWMRVSPEVAQLEMVFNRDDCTQDKQSD